MFKNAIVRKPTESMIHGISSLDLGKPDFEKALFQHDNYCNALIKCGLTVIEVNAEPSFPDGVFVEDTAIVTEKCAIITRPGHDSRRGEEVSIENKLKEFRVIEKIEFPATIDGGDVMRVEDHFYVGLSERTNLQGADQLRVLLEKYGYTSSSVAIEKMLHLKSGVNYIADKTLVMTDTLGKMNDFAEFKKLLIPADESYAANCVLINGYLLIAKGFEKAKNVYSQTGYHLIELDMSEYQKLDGGLSCLSLRF